MLSTSDWLTIITLSLGIFFGTMGGIWTLAWWMGGKFLEQTNLVYRKTEEIKDLFLSKLDSHEIHDNKRFDALINDIWLLRVRNAAKEGLPIDQIEKAHID